MKPEISVVMSAYNVEKYIADAIRSVLRQTFRDYEFIIVNDGSTDRTAKIIGSFRDRRIKVITNDKHDFIGSLNLGMAAARGNYIARMDSDDIMHIDRLKIQYAIMRNNPEIDVCTSWMTLFGERANVGQLSKSVSGIVENPLVHLLGRNIFFNPTSMMRTEFVRKNDMRYQRYDFAEDYKWWVEMARLGATFYVEPQALLNYRLSENQVSTKYNREQRESATKIRSEILDILLKQNETNHPELKEAQKGLMALRDNALIGNDAYFAFFQQLFNTNRHILTADNTSA